MAHNSRLDKYTPDELKIRSALGGRQIGERLAVEQQLNHMGPAGAELLLEFLKDEAAIRTRKKRAVLGVVYGGLATATGLGIALVLTHHPAALVGLSGFSGLAGLAGTMAPSQQYNRIINALSQLDDIRAVGPLAEALSIPDANSRVAVARALSRLLPRLKQQDQELLNEVQRSALRKFLGERDPEREAGLILALVYALTTILDVSALPTMETMAMRAKRTTDDGHVVEALTNSIEVLRETKRRMETPHTLLRASTEPTTTEQLLRAVQTVSDVPAEQLLRAGSSE